MFSHPSRHPAIVVASVSRSARSARGLSGLVCGALLIASPAVWADQTLFGVTTVEGSVQITPTLGTDGIGIQSVVPGASMDQSWLTRGGVGFNIGRAAGTADWQDFTAHLQMSNVGTTPGLNFYLDQTLTSSAAITAVTPLHYTWNRGVVGTSGTSDDITQRAAPIMRLGGASNGLRLIHPTDATKGIEFNPEAGSILVHGRQVVTQTDWAGLDMGQGTSGVGYASAAFGLGNNASGWATLAAGQGNQALGYASATLGAWSRSDGYASMALGLWAAALGSSSVAISGPNIIAVGTSTFAAGSWSEARADQSVVLGRGLVAHQAGEIAMGSYNDFASAAMTGRTLQFVVGNGIEDPANPFFTGDSANRSNALEIETSGRTTIRNKSHATDATAEALDVQGAAKVSRKLTVTGAALLQGGATVTGNTTVNGTVTATQKMRVPASGDLPMAVEFQADGGLGAP